MSLNVSAYYGLRRFVSIPSEHRFDGLDRQSTQAAAVAGPCRQTLPVAITITISITLAITVTLYVAQFAAVAKPAWRQQRHVLHRTTHSQIRGKCLNKIKSQSKHVDDYKIVAVSSDSIGLAT